MPALDEAFDEFMKRRESVSLDYINGNSATLIGISTAHDPATFFPPSGDLIEGAVAVNASNEKGAILFREGSTGGFEVLQSWSEGNLGFWTGLQRAKIRMAGQDREVPMSLRVTEVFRREEGEWKLVHRHADILKSSP